MLTRPPPISWGVANALKVQANAVVTPATIPGIDSGKVTVANARIGMVSGFGMINYDRGLCCGAAILARET